MLCAVDVSWAQLACAKPSTHATTTIAMIARLVKRVNIVLILSQRAAEVYGGDSSKYFRLRSVKAT
jgi:hypothetical protein